MTGLFSNDERGRVVREVRDDWGANVVRYVGDSLGLQLLIHHLCRV